MTVVGKMVKQRRGNDCGIAAVANACGVTYAAAKREFGQVDRDGMSYGEVYWLANVFSCTTHWQKATGNPSLAEWVQSHKKGRYIVACQSIIDGHYLAVIDGEKANPFYDGWWVMRYMRIKCMTRK